MELFEKQVKHYTDKYKETKKIFDGRDYDVYKKLSNITDVKASFEKNDSDFEKFVLSYAKIMPGKVSCTTYASAVARIADDIGVSYKIKAGFCVSKSFPKYETDKKAYEDRKKKGIEHPMLATHVYLETSDGKIYEYFNGQHDIDHIDVVEIV